jgi:hypothetical protein
MNPAQHNVNCATPQTDAPAKEPWVTPRFEIVDVAAETSSSLGVANDGDQLS